MNATTPPSNIVPAGVLPTTDTLTPAGIALVILAPVTVLIDIPPLVWHIRNRNTAAGSLVVWTVLHNFISFINVLIWPTDNFESKYNGEGLCDVEIKFMVARAVAMPAATLCIIRALANVMNTNKNLAIPTEQQRRRMAVMDLVWCLGLPAIMMFFHYIVQPNRYFLAGVSGCQPSIWASWLSVVLIGLPPLLLSVANAFYAALVMWRLFRYRAAFHNILASSNTTKSRFLRLFMISLILTLVLFPYEIYALITDLPRHGTNGGFTWSEVHNKDTWRIIVLYHSTVFYDRWTNIACGFLLFILFGMGRDAQKMYARWLCHLGLGKVFPSLVRKAGHNIGSSSLQASASSKAKLIIKNKLNTFSSKDSTLVSSKDYNHIDPTDPTPAKTGDKHPSKLLPRFFAAFRKDSPSSTEDDEEAAPIRGKSDTFAMTEMSTHGHDEASSLPPFRRVVATTRSEVSADAWSDRVVGQEVLAQRNMLLDKGAVVVRKDIRRASEAC